MEKSLYDSNLRRCLNAMKKYGIKDEDDLFERLSLMPSRDKLVFRERWGLKGDYCHSFRELGEKLLETTSEAHLEYLQSELRLREAHYVKNIHGWQNIGYDRALMLGRIIKKAGIEGMVDEDKLERSLSKLLEVEKHILFVCTGKNLRKHKYFADMFDISEKKVKKLEREALKMIKKDYDEGKLSK